MEKVTKNTLHKFFQEHIEKMNDQQQETLARTKTRICLTAVDLNNKGVLLLDACHYDEAEAFFKKASTLMFRFVVRRLPEPVTENSRPESPLSEPNLNDKDDRIVMQRPIEVCSNSDAGKGEKSPAHSPFAMLPVVDVSSPPPHKKRRTLIVNGISNSHVIGRPLWMKKMSDETQHETYFVTTQTAVILYNLGLAFHLNATHGAKKQVMVERALKLYGIAKQLILSSPASSAFESPVYLVAMHNMMQLYHELGSHALAKSTSSELTKVLRLLRASNAVSEDHYEEFYLKLLAFAKTRSLAPAA